MTRIAITDERDLDKRAAEETADYVEGVQLADVWKAGYRTARNEFGGIIIAMLFFLVVIPALIAIGKEWGTITLLIVLALGVPALYFGAGRLGR